MKKQIIILPVVLLMNFCLKAVPLSMIPVGVNINTHQVIYHKNLMDSIELTSGRIVVGRITSIKDSLLFVQLYRSDIKDFSKYSVSTSLKKIVRINGKPIGDLSTYDQILELSKSYKRFRERYLCYPRIVFEVGCGYVRTPLNEVTGLLRQAAAIEGIEGPPFHKDIKSSFFGLYIGLGLRASEKTSVNAGGILISESNEYKINTFEMDLRYFIISSGINLWISAGFAIQYLETSGSLVSNYEYIWRAASKGYLLGTGVELVAKQGIGIFTFIRYLGFPEKRTIYGNSSGLQKIDLSSTILFFGFNVNM